jgi:hypothetical protein
MPAAAFVAPLFGADRGMTTAVGKESIDRFAISRRRPKVWLSEHVGSEAKFDFRDELAPIKANPE